MGMPAAPATFPAISGPDFSRSDEVEDLAKTVLSRHGKSGGIGRLYDVARAIRNEELRVLYLWNDKPFELEEDVTHDTVGKCIKAPTLWRDVTGYDVVIWIRHYFWDHWDERKRAGVVLHELLHVQVVEDDKDPDQVKVKVRKHDVEEFVDVVYHYGPLDAERERLIKAGNLWAEGQQPAASKPARAKAKAPAAAPPLRVVEAEAPGLGLTCQGNNHVPGCSHMGGEIPPKRAN